jgi:hypothetical protein
MAPTYPDIAPSGLDEEDVGDMAIVRITCIFLLTGQMPLSEERF